MHSNTTALAQSAYGATSTAVRTERSIEYQAFARATNLLAQAQNDPKNAAKFAEALHYNRRLWTILGDDVDNDDNALAPQLRAQILSLALFVKRHTRSVMSGEQTIEPLINVNKTMMRGLRGQKD